MIKKKDFSSDLKSFVKTLRINPEQERFLLDELPKMDSKEKLELLKTLADVYMLNSEEDQTLENLKTNWQ